MCSRVGCEVSGPCDDIDGAKWNALPRHGSSNDGARLRRLREWASVEATKEWPYGVNNAFRVMLAKICDMLAEPEPQGESAAEAELLEAHRELSHRGIKRSGALPWVANHTGDIPCAERIRWLCAAQDISVPEPQGAAVAVPEDVKMAACHIQRHHFDAFAKCVADWILALPAAPQEGPVADAAPAGSAAGEVERLRAENSTLKDQRDTSRHDRDRLTAEIEVLRKERDHLLDQRKDEYRQIKEDNDRLLALVQKTDEERERIGEALWTVVREAARRGGDV